MTQEIKVNINVDTTDFEAKADAFKGALDAASMALDALKEAYASLKVTVEPEMVAQA